MGLSCSIGDDLRGAAECGDQHRCKSIDHQADKLCNSNRTKDSENSSFLGTAVFLCPQILADKGGERQGKAGDGKETEALHLRIRAAAGHCHFPEFVNVGLHHYIRQRNNGILQSCRKAVGNDLPQDQNVDLDPGKADPVFLRAFHQLPQTEKSTDKLRNNGSQGGGTYPQVENSYEKKVQDNIYNGRDHQIDQGMTAVSHRLKDSYHEVIHDKGQGTGEIDTEVSEGLGQDFRRGSHEYQDLGSGQNAYGCQKNSGDKPQRHDGMNGSLNDMEFFSAVIFGYYDTCANCKTVKKSHHEEDEISRGTYRC